MADRTKIEWADATWNPVSGCSHETFAWANDGSVYNPYLPPPGHFPDVMVYRVGRSTAGRALDGRTWEQVPTTV